MVGKTSWVNGYLNGVTEIREGETQEDVSESRESHFTDAAEGKTNRALGYEENHFKEYLNPDHEFQGPESQVTNDETGHRLQVD